MNPNISVFMPVYNGAPYLEKTIENVLRQTYSQFELIMIDDGSSDGSWEILSRFAARDTRIVLVRNEKNLGHAETSNKAIRLARGEFIARQDQDDLSLPERLQKQKEYFHNHPSVGILATCYYRVNAKGERKLCKSPKSHTAIRWKLLFDCVFSHSSIMIRREILAQGEPLYKDLPGPQDYELWTRLCRRMKAAIHPLPLLEYLEPGPQSMTTLYLDRMSDAVLAISAAQIRELLPGRNLSDNDIRTLRRLLRPRKLTKEELAMAPLMLELFESFATQQDVDPKIVNNLRRKWMQRMLRPSSAKHWQDLIKTRTLQTLLRKDPSLLPRNYLVDLPRKAIQRLLSK